MFIGQISKIYVLNIIHIYFDLIAEIFVVEVDARLVAVLKQYVPIRIGVQCTVVWVYATRRSTEKRN